LSPVYNGEKDLNPQITLQPPSRINPAWRLLSSSWVAMRAYRAVKLSLRWLPISAPIQSLCGTIKARVTDPSVVIQSPETSRTIVALSVAFLHCTRTPRSTPPQYYSCGVLWAIMTLLWRVDAEDQGVGQAEGPRGSASLTISNGLLRTKRNERSILNAPLVAVELLFSFVSSVIYYNGCSPNFAVWTRIRSTDACS